MRPSTTTIVVMIGLLAVGEAVREYLATAELTSALDAANARRRDLATDLHQLQQRLSDAEKKRDQLSHDLNVARLKATSPTVTPAARRASLVSPPSVHDAMLNDPQLQNLKLLAQRASLAATYGPLFERLGLSSDQIEKFKDQLLSRDEKKFDADAVREIQGLANTDPAIARFNEQNTTALQTAQQALLGDAGYRQLQDYERSIPARKIVDTFAGTAAVAGTALTPDQAEQLTQVLANTSAVFRSGGRAEAVDWNAALPSATAILSEAQLGIIKRMLLHDQYMQRIQDLAQTPASQRIPSAR